jgi:hypothetical protein
MSKKACLILVIIIFSIKTFSQQTKNDRIVFFDASYLDSFIMSKKKIKVQADNRKLFDYYFNSAGLKQTQLDSLIALNPFFDTAIYQPSGGAQALLNISSPPKTFLSNIGGLDVTNIVNGVASLMIERAKQELTIVFFNRFKKFATTDCPEFQILFPKTTANLTNLLSYTYPQMLPVLRSGFFDDLKQITYNLEGVLELPRYQKLLKNFPEIRVAIKTLRIIHDLENGTSNMAQVIDSLSQISDLSSGGNAIFKNAGSLLKLTAVISNSVRDTQSIIKVSVKIKDTVLIHDSVNQNGNIWVTSKQIKTLVIDSVLTKIYMGLIYQQIKNQNLQYYTSDTTSIPVADSIFVKQKNNILLFQNKIAQFISLATKVNSTLASIKAKKDSSISLTNDDYYNYISVSIDAADYIFSLVNTFDPRFNAGDYLSIAKKSNSLYKDVYTQQYTLAINDAIDILTQVHKLVEESRPGGDSESKDSSSKLLTFVEKVKPYALFIANVADAKTSDDVKAALENVILPVGSSSIKKNTKFNISIQSYLGAFGRTSKTSSSANGIWSDAFGVTAPIGFSITPSFFSWQKGGSLSLFIPLFDIGAAVDYQLTKDSNVISKNYSIKLGQIVSPGVYAVYGFFSNLPLSLGFGAQYGPGLSKINSDGNTVITNPSWRWNFFLAVDLPFFNVVNKPKSAKNNLWKLKF